MMGFRTAAASWLSIFLIASLPVASLPAFGSDNIVVDVRADGAGAAIRAEARLDASRDIVWSVLTDYDRLSEFVPGMFESRVVARVGGYVTVAQRGEARILFFTYPIEVTVASFERPPDALDVRILGGNLRRLEGGYRIVDNGPGDLRLLWNGVIEPDNILPSFLNAALMRPTILDQFAGMVREIKRRETIRRASTN